MVSILAFLVELVTSTVDLLRIFVVEVALRDPLAFVSWVIGALLTTGAVVVLLYLALGALADALVGSSGGLGRTPPPRE